MKFEISPGSEDAAVLLRQIASRPAKQAARKIDKPLAIYGAGKLGKMAIELLERIGKPPDMVVDANPDASKKEPFWRDREILKPSEVSPDTRASFLLAVSIATLPFEELAAMLAAQGWRDIVPFYDVAEAYRDVYPLGNGWVLDQFSDADVAATQQVLDKWGDDISRAHHLQFMAWHRFREDWIFADADVNIENRYFIPEVVALLGEGETFVDVGAHQGEVSERFRAAVGNRYRSVCMIEPDPHNGVNAERSISNLPEGDSSRNHMLKVAVGRKAERRAFFPGLGYASQLSRLGDKSLDITTIDELGLTPSFIKLHLEGGEFDALKGAEAILRACRPIVAATTYHNDLGVWKLPLWAMTALSNYRYYFRLHSWCGTGAVMYCIPDERAAHLTLN